jgi:hypothetical protein
MARLSFRVIALAAWFVVAALTLGITAPVGAGDALANAASDVAADHAPQGLLAVGPGTHARHRAIRHGRTGSRQLPSSQSSVMVTARSNDWAVTMNARRVHVPARHLLLNLIAPRAPATTLL